MACQFLISTFRPGAAELEGSSFEDLLVGIGPAQLGERCTPAAGPNTLPAAQPKTRDWLEPPPFQAYNDEQVALVPRLSVCT